MKRALMLLLVGCLATANPSNPNTQSPVLLIQDTKDVKEVRFLKGESTAKEVRKSSERQKADVDHPYCRMDTKDIFVTKDEDFKEDKGVRVVDQRFSQLCKGLTHTCCSYKELHSLMSATQRNVIDTLSDALVDLALLQRTITNYNHVFTEHYVEKRKERVYKCTGKDPRTFMLFYKGIVKLMEEREPDGRGYKVITLMNRYYRHLSVQALEDNCRLCNPEENRYFFFNNQFLKYEIEFGYKETYAQYYSRTFFDPDVLRLTLFVQAMQCVTSYSSDYVRIDELLALERETARVIASGEALPHTAALHSGYLQFLSFDPFTLSAIRFYSVRKVFFSIAKSAIVDNGSFVERQPTMEVHQKNFYPAFIKKNSIFNYNRDFGFFMNKEIAYNEDADTDYNEALKIFKHAPLATIGLAVLLLRLIVF